MKYKAYVADRLYAVKTYMENNAADSGVTLLSIWYSGYTQGGNDGRNPEPRSEVGPGIDKLHELDAFNYGMYSPQWQWLEEKQSQAVENLISDLNDVKTRIAKRKKKFEVAPSSSQDDVPAALIKSQQEMQKADTVLELIKTNYPGEWEAAEQAKLAKLATPSPADGRRKPIMKDFLNSLGIPVDKHAEALDEIGVDYQSLVVNEIQHNEKRIKLLDKKTTYLIQYAFLICILEAKTRVQSKLKLLLCEQVSIHALQFLLRSAPCLL